MTTKMNGLMRATESGFCVCFLKKAAFSQVAVDGMRTRYNGGPYDSTANEWTAFFK